MRRGRGALVAAFAVVLVGVATLLVARPADDAANPPPAPASTPTTMLPDVGAPDLAAGECATVRYLPDSSPLDHDATWCRPTDQVRGAVVLLHGGGGYSGDRSSERRWAAWYRDRGWATLAIDYTLTGDIDGPTYPAPEQDTKAAVQYARAALGPASDVVIVHGNSAGARLAGQALVTGDDPLFAGPRSWPEVSDRVDGMVGFYGYYDGEVLQPVEYYGAPTPDDGGAADPAGQRADTVALADRASGPVLLFHGDVDRLVTVDQTERFGRALAMAGVDVTTHILLDADHAFDGPLGDLQTADGHQAAELVEGWLDERF